jgi:dimethylargininase
VHRAAVASLIVLDMSWMAFTRAVSPSLAACELTHVARTPIQVDRAVAQHARYEDALRRLGCAVQRVAPAPEHPDAVFIEDTAVVLDEMAVITRPGAESRRGETPAVALALEPHRALRAIAAPGTLDGGDVLVAGRRIFVGRTARSNDDGIAQLAALTAPFGYEVIPVEVRGCLHLKTAATALDDGAVLHNPMWVEPAAFAPLTAHAVHPDEPMGANVVRVGERLLYAEAYPRTLAAMRALGYDVVTVPADELAKAEGAVTCCSLIFRE